MTEKGTKESFLVAVEGKYGILRDSKNWIVSELKPSKVSVSCQQDDFDHGTNTYHQNIRQAIIELSNRLLNDSLSKATKERALTIKELAETINTNDQWMRKSIMGRCSA